MAGNLPGQEEARAQAALPSCDLRNRGNGRTQEETSRQVALPSGSAPGAGVRNCQNGGTPPEPAGEDARATDSGDSGPQRQRRDLPQPKAAPWEPRSR